MEAVLIVPLLLTLNTAVASHILPRFTAVQALKRETYYELLNRSSSILFQLYLCYNGFYLTPERVEWMAGSMAGYMLYETIHMAFYSRSIDMYIHHTVYPLAYVISLYGSDKETRLLDFTRIVTLSCLLESTSPFLTVSWCLHTFKYPVNETHKFFRLVAGIYWSFVRIGVFPYYIFLINDMRYYAICIPFFGLQLYWFRLILKKIAT